VSGFALGVLKIVLEDDIGVFKGVDDLNGVIEVDLRGGLLGVESGLFLLLSVWKVTKLMSKY
jgi:hypothetical protein